jgi:D-glycero-alpha-D-manno-heptose-7-phosphate kinase
VIISRTPLRISFAGGGSDLPAFYRQTPGVVVSTSINKYIYITVNKKFDRQIRASYSITEMVDSVDELKHELIREALRLVGLDGGIEITSISDIPSMGTGLGSSSTYTVGLLNALYAYRGQHVGAERLAREACQIEIDLCGKPIGKQDQYIAAYGGFQNIRFNSDESVFVNPVIFAPETKLGLQNNLLLFYTGITRSADKILEEQTSNTYNSLEKRDVLQRIVAIAQDMRSALVANDLSSFGELLHQGWMAKKQMASGISTPDIDEWYQQALAHGAIGGKITGAGGGGFLMLYAPKSQHTEIKQALYALQPIDFHFEPQGSRIIYIEESS